MWSCFEYKKYIIEIILRWKNVSFSHWTLLCFAYWICSISELWCRLYSSFVQCRIRTHRNAFGQAVSIPALHNDVVFQCATRSISNNETMREIEWQKTLLTWLVVHYSSHADPRSVHTAPLAWPVQFRSIRSRATHSSTNIGAATTTTTTTLVFLIVIIRADLLFFCVCECLRAAAASYQKKTTRRVASRNDRPKRSIIHQHQHLPTHLVKEVCDWTRTKYTTHTNTQTNQTKADCRTIA